MSLRVPIQGLSPKLGDEVALNTPVTPANNMDMATTVRYYSTFTMPSNATFYVATKVEWKNGTNVAGNIYVGLEYVAQHPPTSSLMLLAAYSAALAQAGADTIQSQTRVTSGLILGGSIMAAYVGSTSATSDIQSATVSSKNITKAVAVTASLANETAWGAATEEPYIKIYGKPVLI